DSLSRNTQYLVGLDAEPPFRMRLAVRYCKLCIRFPVRTIHRLKQEVPEFHVHKSFRLSLLLRVDELEFIPMSKDHWSIRFRAHTNPIQPRGRWLGAICLDGYLEALSVQRIDQGFVELEQWFTSRANDEASARRVPIGPVCGNRPRQGMRGIELP